MNKQEKFSMLRSRGFSFEEAADIVAKESSSTPEHPASPAKQEKRQPRGPRKSVKRKGVVSKHRAWFRTVQDLLKKKYSPTEIAHRLGASYEQTITYIKAHPKLKMPPRTRFPKITPEVKNEILGYVREDLNVTAEKIGSELGICAPVVRDILKNIRV